MCEIAELIKKRDQRGMEELLDKYAPLMRYIASPILSDERDIEECVSEAAMRVWEKIELFDPVRGSFKAWLTALTRNCAINYAKRVSCILPEEKAPLTVEEEVIRRERAAKLWQAVRALPEKDRLLFYRKYYFLQSTKQIAAEFSMTERAVEGKLYRMKKRLRKMMGGVMDE